MQSKADILLALAEGTSRHIGQSFLDSLSVSLRDTMNVSAAMLTERVGDPSGKRARTVVAVAGDEPFEVEYDLKGTPCELVYGGENLSVRKDLGKRFNLINSDFSSYVGVPLFANDNRDWVFGHLSVMSVDPMEDSEMAETILRIYGQRAEAEMQRVAIEKEREQLLEDLHGLNQRLSDNYDRVRQANEYKTQALGLVAHDLKNPLGQILGFADLIGMTLDEDEPLSSDRVREDLDQIVQVGNTMLGQVRRILDGAREEARELPLHATEVDLKETVDRAIRVNEGAAQKKGIAIGYQGAAALPAVVDADLVLEALDNLINNAVKYSPSQTSVTVAAGLEAGSIRLSVQDEGLGLDADDTANAFQQFQRLSAAPTAGEESTGLGLYNVRMVAERHGGTVRVTSPGKGLGATFSINLPAEPPVVH